jgi:uncharacterized membrane protein YccC
MRFPRQASDRVLRRFDADVFRWIVPAVVASGLAWEIASHIPGHPYPFFAPIAAVISLSAERGRRGRQATELLIGVAIGIVIGSAMLVLFGAGGWQIAAVVAVAFVLGTAVGARPTTIGESAVSAILVVGVQRVGSNYAYNRLTDALIGGGIAILTAQLLFPVEPLDLVRKESVRVREELADALDEVAAALRERDRERAEAALQRVDGIDERRLYEALALARVVARRAPRRWAARRRLEPIGELVASLDAAVGDARPLVTAALRTIDTPHVPPKEAADAVELLAEALRTIDPEVARATAEQAWEASEVARAKDDSLGIGVLAHAVASIIDDVQGTARAREETRRVGETQPDNFLLRERRLPGLRRDDQPRPEHL